jgi:hypothetical protein
MMRCDFTQDFLVGFDSEVLFKFVQQMDKTAYRTAQFCIKVPSQLKNCSITFYNKIMYYILVKSLRTKIGFMVSMLFDNENKDLQQLLNLAKETGLTRMELRFEHFEFESTEHYKQQLLVASCLL